MEFWDDISKTLTNVAENTVKGAEKITEIAKLKYALYNEQNKLNNVYQNMGKLFHEDCKENLPTIKVQCTVADEIISRINKIKSELAEASFNSECASCGSKVNKDMKFCPACGEKIFSNADE